MKSIGRTITESYMKYEGKNVPINLIPSGVKCIECGQYYPNSQLQNHLATHINPQYIKLSQISQINKMEKINLGANLQDPQKLQEIWVKSFMPDDLPQMQKEKKVAAKLGGQHSLLKNSIFKGLNQVNPFGNDLISNLGQTSETVQSQSQLDVKKNIKLSRVANNIEKKQLHVYMNEHGISTNYDGNIAKPKRARDEQTEASDGYSVTQAPVASQYTRQDAPQTPRKQNRQTYNIKSGAKNPVNPLYISTASKFQPQVSSRTKLNSPKSTILDKSSDHSQKIEHNHTCPCCKGFYCSYCKSSVPPIYRPVPDQDGKYHFHPDQKSIQFYKNHYYPRQDVNVCTGCQKKMEISRMVSSRRQQNNETPFILK